MKNTIIAVLSILVIGLGGFLLYDKVLSSKDKSKIITETSTEKDSNNKDDYVKTFYQNLKNNRTVSVDYDHNINVVMDKEGNIYYSGDIVKSLGEKKEYSIDGYQAGIDNNGKMSNVLSGYKLNVSDVVMFFYGASGNGGWRDYIFVKSDGTIAKLTYSISYDKKVTIEKFEENVSGYTNIVGIQTANSWDAHGYKLIDINGKVY